MPFFKNLIIVIVLFTLSASCSSKKQVVKNNSFFAKGGDISWLPQMEASGFKFYNEKGQAEDCLKILKDNGMNSIRLRTWVNPSDDKINGHCSKDETVAMAVRAHSQG